MTPNLDKHQRRSIRLKHYDYSQAGAYFITICTYDKECLFGKVTNGEMVLNEYGKVVEEEWYRSGKIRHEIELDAFIVMPNHIHGVVTIVGAQGLAPLQHDHAHLQRKPRSLSTFVTGFKSAVTIRVNELRGTLCEPVWQRNYYEHVIRNEHDLNDIREYIVNNAQKWDSDSENPSNDGTTSRSPLRKT
ncbi:MAG: transposase [Chloroflexi bacterium]|nr:transposase [Chloroflexota bacterium]